jgi:cytochrome c-type biogenesis protein CcmH/NrfG
MFAELPGEDLEEDLDEELDRDLEEELDEGLGLDLEEDLDEGLVRDLEEDLDEGLVRDLEEDLDEGLVRDLEEELDEGLGEDLEEELDQDLDEELEEAPEEELLSGPVIILGEDETDATAQLPPATVATPVLEPPPPARVVAAPVPSPSPTPEVVPPPVPPTPAPPAESLAPACDAERALAGLTAFCDHIRDEDDFDVLGITEDAADAAVRYAYEGLIDTLPSEAAIAELPALKDLADEARKRIDRAFDRLRLGSSRKVYAQLRPQSVKGRKKPEAAKAPEQIAAEKAAHLEELAARGLDAESWFRRGDSFFEEKSYGQAVEAYGMAAHLDPKEGEYLARLGYAQFLQNPKDAVVLREALENIAKGIKLAPKQEKPYVYLGKIFRQNGAADRARKMFESAVRIKPDCQEALQELRLLDLRQQAKGGNLLGRLKGILD